MNRISFVVNLVVKQNGKVELLVGDQLDRWNELKEVLRIQTHASDDNGSAILEVGICHIEGRSSYFLPQKVTIIYFQ